MRNIITSLMLLLLPVVAGAVTVPEALIILTTA